MPSNEGSGGSGGSFSCHFDETQLAQLSVIGKRVVEAALSLTAQSLWGEIRKEAPTDHGRLAGSFELEQRGEHSFVVHTAVEYALIVQEGSQAHAIEPVNAQAVFWNGASHPFRRVWHPGTKPNPYIDRAINTTSGRMEEFAMRAVREAGGAAT